MGPRPTHSQSGDLFRQPLHEQINTQHPLVLMAARVDWAGVEALGRSLFKSRMGRPATAPRLMAGLLYLQHLFGLSNEEVVLMWVENPYWQVFCGETHLQVDAPIDPSSLTRWRQRLGANGVAELNRLMKAAGSKAGNSQLKAVTLKAAPVLRGGYAAPSVPARKKTGPSTDAEAAPQLPVVESGDHPLQCGLF